MAVVGVFVEELFGVEEFEKGDGKTCWDEEEEEGWGRGGSDVGGFKLGECGWEVTEG